MTLNCKVETAQTNKQTNNMAPEQQIETVTKTLY